MKVSIVRLIGIAALLYGPYAYAEKTDCESVVQLGSALDNFEQTHTDNDRVNFVAVLDGVGTVLLRSTTLTAVTNGTQMTRLAL